MDEANNGLSAQVEHLLVDFADMKADIRRIDGKIDSVKSEVVQLRSEMKDGFLVVHNRISASEQRVVELDGRMTASIKRLTESVSELKASVTESRGDHKNLLWGGIAASAFLLVAMGAAYAKLSERSDDIHSEMSQRYDRLYEKLSAVQVALERVAALRDPNPSPP